MKENPSGKNPFGMTFDEQRQFQLVQDKLKALSQAKVAFEQAKSQFETLSAMKERTAALSQDAKALYEREFAEAKSKVEKAKADLDQLASSLTSEMIAEYERQKKAYDLKKKALEDEKKAKEQKEKEEKEAQALKAKKAKEEYEALKWEMAPGSVIPAIMSSMVKIPGKDYLIGKTEVTQEIWEKVMGNNPAHFKGPDRPVENVSWNDCQAFVEKLNAASAVKSAKLRFRLPTAEEWEFACRAGGKGDWGKRANGEEGPLDPMGWFGGNSGYETHPVAQKEPNAFGLYDMHGNVWEWTSTADGDNRVNRGGGWSNDSWYCTAGCRLRYNPDYRHSNLGFRLAALPESVIQAEEEKKRKEEEKKGTSREELQKKAAVAREELAGWPCASERNPAMLSVYGTNIQGTLEKCCNVEVIVNSASAFRRMRMSDATSFNLYLLCEKECHVVFSSEHTAVVESGWESGKGTCLIDNFDTDYWHKYDENGRLVKWGHFTKFEEYLWVTNRHTAISARLREAWAKNHGLTQEQAEKRAQELIEVIEESTKDGLQGGLRRSGSQPARSGLVGGGILRARRLEREKAARADKEKAGAAAAEREAERQAQAEADKAQREAERAEQRRQLQAIQEELKRVREEKAAAKAARE